MNLLDQLTPEQKEAVIHIKGPVLVIAGAGTGKTRIITYRYAYLVNEKNVSSEKILAVTFTEKATKEMQKRIDSMIDSSIDGEKWINTFHAFSSKILKDKARIIGLKPNFKVLNKLEQGVFFRKTFDNLPLNILRPLNNPYQYFDSLIAYFNRIKEELVGPDEYKVYVDNLRNSNKDDEKIKREEEILLSYVNYEGDLKANNSLDFASLVFHACFILKKYPEVLKEYQDKFSYIMVDEYQDTNFAQSELIKMLADMHKNILVVGDDDQSIYKFRGASVANILDFEKSFPGAKKVVLTKNFRSYQPILDLAYMSIQNNNPNRLEKIHNINKKLRAERKGTKNITLIKSKDHYEEADEIAQNILKLKKNKTNYNQIAILLRSTKNQAEPICQALKNNNIPYCVVGESGFFQRKIIKDLMALLGFLSDPNEDIYLYRLLSIFNFNEKDLIKLGQMCKEKRARLFSIIENCKEVDSSCLRPKIKKINEFYTWIKSLSKQHEILPFLDIIYENMDYFTKLIKANSEDNLLLNKFKSFAKEFQEKYEVKRLEDFLFYLDLARKLYEDFSLEDEEGVSSMEDKVQIMTVHKAKGLEFEHVFIANLADLRFPPNRRSNPLELPESLIKETLPKKEAHQEEERRLFYVATTRAKNSLFLSYAENYGGVRKKKPSVFLEEISEFPFTEVCGTPEVAAGFSLRGTKRGLKPAAMPEYDIRLSYTQINSYETCPLKYKYAYVDNIPYRPGLSMIFGSFIHDVMEVFYKNFQETKEFKKEYLLKLFEDNWPKVTFSSKRQEEDYREKAKEMITVYFERNKNTKNDPIFIEKSFVFQLDNNITINGRIDRIDKINDEKVEVIDYKSSFREPPQRDIDKDYQMTIYAMVTKEVFKLSPDLLSVYYVMTDKKFETQRNEDDFEDFKVAAKNIADQIKANNFNPKKGWHCKYCDYSFICPEMERKY